MQKILNSLAIFSVLASSIALPTMALVIPQNLTCNAAIASNNGSSLTYKITGRSRGNFTITVQRRDRNNRISTLLDRAPLNAFEEIAPDADYSQLPFTGQFRGKANDGRGIYSMARSQHGLYASLRPLSDSPQQVQIVHYLGAGQFVRSGAGTCTLG